MFHPHRLASFDRVAVVDNALESRRNFPKPRQAPAGRAHHAGLRDDVHSLDGSALWREHCGK